jgi:EmrB/QacA subfamily drug resistance transporter
MDNKAYKGRWFFFFLVASGVFLSTLDSSMVNVALPEIMRYFSASLNDVKLVVLVYLMVITVSLVFWGKIADRFGKGRVYVLGMGFFLTGALSCGASVSLNYLIVSRCFQALGASMMMSSGPALLKITSPREHLGKTLGLVGIATSCGLMIGPVVSGYILTHLSWRAIFWVSVLPGGIVLALSLLRLLPRLAEIEEKRKTNFDWTGGCLWSLLVGAYALMLNGIVTSALAICAWIVTVILLIVLFYRVEQRSDAPILPIIEVKKRYYWAGASTAALSFAGLFIVLITLPFYLDYVLQYPVNQIGMAMMALPVSLVIMAPCAGWLFDRTGSARIISTFGLLLSALALLLLMQLDSSTSFFSVAWRLTLLGAGQSIFLSPNSASVLSQVDEKYAGITSGILATARNFGMLTGTALAGAGFTFFYSKYTAGQTLQTFQSEMVSAFLKAQHDTLVVALFLLLTAVLISALRS